MKINWHKLTNFSIIQVEPILGHISLTLGRPAVFIEIFSIFQSWMTSVFYLASGSKKPHPSASSHPTVAVVHSQPWHQSHPHVWKPSFCIHVQVRLFSSFLCFSMSPVSWHLDGRVGDPMRGGKSDPQLPLNRFHQRKIQHHQRAVKTLIGQTSDGLMMMLLKHSDDNRVLSALTWLCNSFVRGS